MGKFYCLAPKLSSSFEPCLKIGGTAVSRKVIGILFIIGSCLYIPGIVMIIWGYMVLFQASVQHVYPVTRSLNGPGTFIGFLFSGIVMAGIGSIVVLAARTVALIKLAEAQEWIW